MQLGAVLERMGGYGRVLCGYNGLQPSVDAIRWLDLSQAHLQVLAAWAWGLG